MREWVAFPFRLRPKTSLVAGCMIIMVIPEIKGQKWSTLEKVIEAPSMED